MARIPKLVWGESEERKLSELDFKAFFKKKKKGPCVSVLQTTQHIGVILV